jgi:invasion protein IalB
MSKSMDGWSALRRAARSALLAACGLGLGTTLAIAQQVQEVPKKPQQSAKRAGEQTAWVKVCTKDERPGNKQICLVKHEGLEPKTGAILIAAGVRTIEGEDTQHLVVNVPTTYALMMPAGVQIKIDEGEPIQLQYSVCLPTNCQVQMELSKDMSDKMRAGKQMFVAAVNMQQKTMAFPVPLQGFAKTFDGAPVNNAAYQEARNQMLQAARERQIELAKQAAAAQQKKQQAVGQPQVAPPAAAAPQ